MRRTLLANRRLLRTCQFPLDFLMTTVVDVTTGVVDAKPPRHTLRAPAPEKAVGSWSLFRPRNSRGLARRTSPRLHNGPNDDLSARTERSRQACQKGGQRSRL